MSPSSSRTIDNEEKKRFELLDGENLLAFIDYSIGKSGRWYLIHTEVVAPEGKGFGKKIVTDTLDIMDDRQEKIVPSCPFVKAFVLAHYDDYKQVLAYDIKP